MIANHAHNGLLNEVEIIFKEMHHRNIGLYNSLIHGIFRIGFLVIQ